MPLLVVAVDSRVKKLKEKLNMKCKNDLLREAVAEFLATFILTLIGDSITAVLTLKEAGNIGLAVGPLGWGLALMLAISVTGGVSGCHANPAVTLAMASVGKLPWKKVLAYFFAQYMGAFVAAIVIYSVYYELITSFDGGNREIPPHAAATAQIFSTFLADNSNILTSVWEQIVSGMLFIMAIVAITDPHNLAVHKGSYPFAIGLSLTTIIYAFPLNCGAPLNPARDLGPRVFTAIAGWGGKVFSFKNYGYFWIPVVGPHVGGVLGAWIYRLLIEQHWPVDSYDFAAPSEIKTNGEFKKTEDLPFIDKKRSTTLEIRKVDE